MEHLDRERIERDSWQWLRDHGQLPSRPIGLTTVAAGKIVYQGRCILTGWLIENVATSGGGLMVYDGTDANGLLIGGAVVAASAFSSQNMPGRGVQMDQGVYINPVTASLTGAVFIIPLWDYDFTPPGH